MNQTERIKMTYDCRKYILMIIDIMTLSVLLDRIVLVFCYITYIVGELCVRHRE